MGLTVAEKNHWKERIAMRIDQRIEALVANQDPSLLQRVAELARNRALKSLGIDAQQRELKEIEKQKEQNENRERRLWAEQRAIINGTSIEEEIEYSHYRYERGVEDAIGARAKVLEGEALFESDLGRQVLALRREKDNLLDTVWLATSSSQIKELWQEINALLEMTPTSLEEKALKMEPMQDEQS